MATSSYSKLSTNDCGLGLINECLSVYYFNININDKIKLFQTLFFLLIKMKLKNNIKI